MVVELDRREDILRGRLVQRPAREVLDRGARRRGVDRPGELAGDGDEELLQHLDAHAAGALVPEPVQHLQCPVALRSAVGVVRIDEKVSLVLVLSAQDLLGRETPLRFAILVRMEPVALGPDDGEKVQRTARHHRILAELPDLGVIELRFGPDFEGVEPHEHADHVDSFFVLEGEAEFVVGDEAFRAGPGAASRCRSARATASATRATASCGC